MYVYIDIIASNNYIVVALYPLYNRCGLSVVWVWLLKWFETVNQSFGLVILLTQCCNCIIITMHPISELCVCVCV